MADGHHSIGTDVLHPVKRSKSRTTMVATLNAPPRHVRPHANSVIVRQAIDGFLLARTDYRPSTRKEHGDILSRFANFAEAAQWPSLAEITNMHVRAWLANLNEPSVHTGRPLSKARKNKCGAVVRTFLRWTIAEGFADERVIHNIKWPPAPKLTDSMIAVTQDDFSRLLAACDLHTWHGVRDYAILVLLYDTGIRRGELLAMVIADVESVDRAASVVSGKSGTRAVGMGISAHGLVVVSPDDHAHPPRRVADCGDDRRGGLPSAHQPEDVPVRPGDGVMGLTIEAAQLLGRMVRLEPQLFWHTAKCHTGRVTRRLASARVTVAECPHSGCERRPEAR